MLGNDAKFLSILSENGFDSNDYQPNELTLKVMERIKRTGSLYDDNITGIEDLNDFFEIDY
jgi:hypothetical protein